MSIGTLIQWCYATVNFWWGCCEVSTGCRNCYAKKMAKRLSRGRATWGPGGLRWLRVGEAGLALLQLEKRAVKRGTRYRVFINSMSDTFEDRRDLDQARGLLFSIAPCVPHLDLLLLTKRVEAVEQLVPAEWMAGAWPANVWLGTTVENQAAAEKRIPELLPIPAPIKFLSCEPLVGHVDLADHIHVLGRYFIDWVIAGGESGQHARPCDLDWLRSLRDQCAAAGTAFFLKQLGRRPVDMLTPASGPREIVRLQLKDGHGGDMAEWPLDLRIRQIPQASYTEITERSPQRSQSKAPASVPSVSKN